MRPSTAPATVAPGHSVLWREQMEAVRLKAGPDLNTGTVLRTALYVLSGLDADQLRLFVQLARKAEDKARMEQEEQVA